MGFLQMEASCSCRDVCQSCHRLSEWTMWAGARASKDFGSATENICLHQGNHAEDMQLHSQEIPYKDHKSYHRVRGHRQR